MTSPNIVVFDLGKVLVDFDYAIAVRRIAMRSTITVLELAKLLLHTTLMTEFETGLLTNEEFFKQVCAVTGFRGDLEEFAGLFGDIFIPIEPMIQLHAELRQRGVKTYIFSNTNELSIRHIRQSFPFFSHFDGYIYSYEHRVMKPNAGLYEVVERQSGCRGAEILYLDDLPQNIAAGAARGWQAVLHESPEKSRAAMLRAGLFGHDQTD